MDITHDFVCAVPDLAGSFVKPSDWNDPHVILALTADPGAPVEGQIWVVVSGTTPTRVAALKIYDGATTRTIASITY